MTAVVNMSEGLQASFCESWMLQAVPLFIRVVLFDSSANTPLCPATRNSIMLCKLPADFIESLSDFESTSPKTGVKPAAERDFTTMTSKYGPAIIRKINISIIWEIVRYIKCTSCVLFGLLTESFFYLSDRIFPWMKLREQTIYFQNSQEFLYLVLTN